jgi:hypothetical protein
MRNHAMKAAQEITIHKKPLPQAETFHLQAQEQCLWTVYQFPQLPTKQEYEIL